MNLSGFAAAKPGAHIDSISDLMDALELGPVPVCAVASEAQEQALHFNLASESANMLTITETGRKAQAQSKVQRERFDRELMARVGQRARLDTSPKQAKMLERIKERAREKEEKVRRSLVEGGIVGFATREEAFAAQPTHPADGDHYELVNLACPLGGPSRGRGWALLMRRGTDERFALGSGCVTLALPDLYLSSHNKVALALGIAENRDTQ